MLMLFVCLLLLFEMFCCGCFTVIVNLLRLVKDWIKHNEKEDSKKKPLRFVLYAVVALEVLMASLMLFF